MSVLFAIFIILFAVVASYLTLVGLYQYGNEGSVSPLGLLVYYPYPFMLMKQGLFPPYGKNSAGLTVGTTVGGVKKVPQL